MLGAGCVGGGRQGAGGCSLAPLPVADASREREGLEVFLRYFGKVVTKLRRRRDARQLVRDEEVGVVGVHVLGHGGAQQRDDVGVAVGQEVVVGSAGLRRQLLGLLVGVPDVALELLPAVL